MRRYRRPQPQQLPQAYAAARHRPLRGKARRPCPQKVLLLAVAAALCLGLLTADHFLLPTLRTMSINQANMICTQTISDAVSQELEKQPLDSIVRLSRNSQGDITAIETDYAAVDRFKANITQKILESFQNNSLSDLSIPLGTLLNSVTFNGRGPNIPFRVFPSRSASVDIQGKFISSGINQTLHQITLTVDVDAIAMIPGASTSTHVSTSFLLAETVIIGDVPAAYADIGTGALSIPNAAPKQDAGL